MRLIPVIGAALLLGCSPGRDGTPPADLLPDDAGVFVHLIPLGDGPSWPSWFGEVRPGMTHEEAERLRPATFGGRWRLQLGETPKIDAQIVTGRGPRVESLVLYVDRADLRARLEAAWGPPAIRTRPGAVKPAVCWLAEEERLKACFHDRASPVSPNVTFTRYTPIAVAVGAGGELDPVALGEYLGRTRDELVAEIPDLVEDRLLSKRNPALEQRLPPSDVSTDLGSDTITIYFDEGSGRANRVVVAFWIQDERRFEDAARAVRGAARRTDAPGRRVRAHTDDRMSLGLGIDADPP